MTDRTDTTPPGRPAYDHPMREWFSLDLFLPSHAPLLERVLDRFEAEAKS